MLTRKFSDRTLSRQPLVHKRARAKLKILFPPQILKRKQQWQYQNHNNSINQL